MIQLLQKALMYIKYTIQVSQLKVSEPEYVLPIDHALVIRNLIKTGKSTSYKLFPSREHLLYSKIRVDRIKVNFENLNYKHIYSCWLNDIRFKDRELVKYSEDDMEFMLDSLKEQLFKWENSKTLREYSFEQHNISWNFTQNILESLLVKIENPLIQEYILDQIFRFYPDHLYSLIDVVLTSKFNNYIHIYYTKLLIFLFEFQDFSKLIKYFDQLDSTYTTNNEASMIKKRLLEIIQRKSVLEVQLQELNKK